MKILIVQVGNFVTERQMRPEVYYYRFPVLPFGEKYFDEKQVINNVQTRSSIEDSGIEVKYLFHTDRNSITGLLRSSWHLRQLTKEFRPDITHIYWGGISGFLAALFAKGKTIVSLLGSDLYGSYKDDGSLTLNGQIQRFCSRLTGFVATGIITMSDRMRKYMWKPTQKKIRVIPEGISLDKFSPRDKDSCREYLGWPKDKKIVIFFYEGQVVKNYPLASAAIEELQVTMPDLDFRIISGFRHEDLVYVYNAADCLLMTSLHEGSNNSVKEAIACNLPVVSVPCGDADERLLPVKNCYVSSAYDPDELAGLLKKVLDSNERSNGVEFIDEVTLKTCAKKVIGFYEELCGFKAHEQSK